MHFTPASNSVNSLMHQSHSCKVTHAPKSLKSLLVHCRSIRVQITLFSSSTHTNYISKDTRSPLSPGIRMLLFTHVGPENKSASRHLPSCQSPDRPHPLNIFRVTWPPVLSTPINNCTTTMSRTDKATVNHSFVLTTCRAHRQLRGQSDAREVEKGSARPPETISASTGKEPARACRHLVRARGLNEYYQNQAWLPPKGSTRAAKSSARPPGSPPGKLLRWPRRWGVPLAPRRASTQPRA